MRAHSSALISLYMQSMTRGRTGAQWCSRHRVCFAIHRYDSCCRLYLSLCMSTQATLSAQMHTTPNAQKPLQTGDPMPLPLRMGDKQSSMGIALVAMAAGSIGDDWWYSLSPHYRNATKPQRSGWQFRVRHLLRDQPLGCRFRDRLEALHRYKERWGDMNVPRRFWEDWALGIWVSDVRAASRQQWLNPTQTRSLQDMCFPFKTSAAVDWDFHFHELRRFQEEMSCTGPDVKWQDPTADFGNSLAKWYHQLPEQCAQRTLTPGQVDKLHRIGVKLTEAGAATLCLSEYADEHQKIRETGSDSHFQAMFAKLCIFRHMYGTSLVPRQVFDNLSLGDWVHALRRQGKKRLLSAWKRACLERVHFVWNVDHQTALWHYHLHEARRYKLTFGHARIPEDYHNIDQPGWIGAARWITRNAMLFAKGKLGDKRYGLIRNILGIKFVKKIGGAPLWKDGNMPPHNVTIMGPWNRQHQKAT